MSRELQSVRGSGKDVAKPHELSTEHRDVLRLLGYFFLRQDRADDAIAVFRGLFALDRDDRHAHRALIYAYLAADHPERALEVAGSYDVRSDEPHAATIHLLRAQALWRLHRRDEAREHLQLFTSLRQVR